jgi:hypothetical protein
MAKRTLNASDLVNDVGGRSSHSSESRLYTGTDVKCCRASDADLHLLAYGHEGLPGTYWLSTVFPIISTVYI